MYHLKTWFCPEESNVVAHSIRKRKKQICGTEEEIVVAHGRLPSPAPLDTLLAGFILQTTCGKHVENLNLSDSACIQVFK